MLKGVHFLGTPFQGSLVAEAARPYVNALAKINPYPTNPHLVSALTKNRPDLATIVSKFRSLQIEWGIQIWVGYETKPIGGNLVSFQQRSFLSDSNTIKGDGSPVRGRKFWTRRDYSPSDRHHTHIYD